MELTCRDLQHVEGGTKVPVGRWRTLFARTGEKSGLQQGIPMNTLVGALITFIVVLLLLYLVNMLPLDGRARQIVRVIIIVLGIISLLKYLAVA